jgi:hypothetical protein
MEVFPDINVATHDRDEMLAHEFLPSQGWEHREKRSTRELGSSKSLISDSTDLTIWKLVGLLQSGALGSSLYLLFKVKGHVAQLLLYVPDDFTLGSSTEDNRVLQGSSSSSL